MREAGFARIMVLWVIAVVSILCLSGSCLTQGNVAERYLLAAANAERAARGIAPLAWDDALAAAAADHAREQASRQAISHRFAGEEELAERGAHTGARFSVIAENVAEAPTAVEIQRAWMRSPGHRANLLDATVDAVGIAIVTRNGQMYAVEDFARSTLPMRLDEQEAAVAALVERHGVRVTMAVRNARATCALESGFSGSRQPDTMLRFTAGRLDRLSDEFVRELGSQQYREAVVGACADPGASPFTGYRVVILLYR